MTITAHYELTKRYRRKQTVTVCTRDYHDYLDGRVKELWHRLNDEWVKRKPPVKNYLYYSHCFSPEIFKDSHPHIYEKLLNNSKR